MSALALKGQKHRWYCICAICIWLNSLITMADSWVSNVQAESTQLEKIKIQACLGFSLIVYTKKVCLIASNFVYYPKELKKTIKQLGTLKMSLRLLSNRPHQVLLSTDEVPLMLSLLPWLHWFCRLITMLNFFNFKVHMKTTNYIQ